MASQINQPHVCEDCLICYDRGSKLVRHQKTMRHEEMGKHQEFLDSSQLEKAREKLNRKRQKKAEKMEAEVLEAGTSGVSSLELGQ